MSGLPSESSAGAELRATADLVLAPEARWIAG